MSIDLIFKTVAVFGVSAFTSIVGLIGQGFATGIMLMAFFVINWLYSFLFEAFWNGHTPGKRLFKLRVVRSNGTPITFYDAFGRSLLLAAEALPGPYTVGVIVMCCTKRMQRLGDLVFDTIVVDETSEFSARPSDLHTVEPIQRADCAGRFHVPERTLTVVERLFDENRPISEPRREEIAAVLADAWRKRLGYQGRQEQTTEPGSPIAIDTQPVRAFSEYSVPQADIADVSGDRQAGGRTNRPRLPGLIRNTLIGRVGFRLCLCRRRYRAMNRDRFLRQRANDWRRFEKLVYEMKRKRVARWNSHDVTELSKLYRSICYDLSLVQSREWGAQLERYLN